MLIFISYKSADRALVESMANDLHDLGHTTWLDQELAGGQTWWNSILKNVRECDLFVFALSPQSLDSYPCQLEYNYADKLGKRILPVLISNINTDLLSPALSKIQYVDYRIQDKKASIGLARALASLPPLVPLPEPLPIPPEAPISGLGRIKERIEHSAPLSSDEQASLVLELKSFYQKTETAVTARQLFERLRSRSDLFATIDHEIESILGLEEPVNKSPPIISKPISTPPTTSKVKLPKILTRVHIRSMLWHYFCSVLAAFVFITPMTTLDDPSFAFGNQVVIALIAALGLILAKTLPNWLREHLPKRISRLRLILALLISSAFAEIITHYISIYVDSYWSMAIFLPASLLVLGFVIGTTSLRDGLGLRILVGTAGALGCYLMLYITLSFRWSFPLISDQSIWVTARDIPKIYNTSIWGWYIAIALACSLLVYWPEIVSSRKQREQ